MDITGLLPKVSKHINSEDSSHCELEREITDVKRHILSLDEEVSRNEQIASKSRLVLKKDLADLIIAQAELSKVTESRIQSLTSKTTLNSKHIDSIETRVLSIPDMSGVLSKLNQLESKIETMQPFISPDIQDNSQVLLKQISDLRTSISRDGNVTTSNINKLSSKLQSLIDKINPFMDSHVMTDDDITSLIETKFDSISTSTDSRLSDLHESSRSLMSRLSLVEKRGDSGRGNLHLTEEISKLNDEFSRMEDDFSIRDSEVDARFIGFDDKITTISSNLKLFNSDTTERNKSLSSELGRLTESTNKSIRELRDITSNDSSSKKISDIEQQISKIQSKLASLTDTSGDTTKTNTKIQSITNDLDSLNRRMSDISENMPSNLLDQLITIHSDIENLDGRMGSIDSISVRLNDLSSSNSKLLGSMTRFSNDANTFNGKLSDLADRVNILQSLYESKQESGSGGSTEIKSLLDTIRTNFSKYGSSIDSLSGKFEGSSLRITDLEETITRLKSQLIDVKDNSSKNDSLKDDLTELSSRFDVISGNEERFNIKLEDILSSQTHSNDSKFSEIQKSMKSQNSKMDDYGKRLTSSEENYGFQESLITHLSSRLDDQEKTLIDLESNTYESQFSELKKSISGLKDEDEYQHRLIKDVTSYIDSSILESNTQNESVFTAIQNKFGSVDSKVESINRENDSISSRLDKTNSKIDDLYSRDSGFSSDLSEQNKLLSKLESQISNQDLSLKKFTGDFSKKSNDIIEHINEYDSKSSRQDDAIKLLNDRLIRQESTNKEQDMKTREEDLSIQKIMEYIRKDEDNSKRYELRADEQDSKINEQDSTLRMFSDRMTRQNSDSKKQEIQIQDLFNILREYTEKFEEQDSHLKEQDSHLKEQDSHLKEQDVKLKDLFEKLNSVDFTTTIDDLKEKTKSQDSLLLEIAEMLNEQHTSIQDLPKIIEDIKALKDKSGNDDDERINSLEKMLEHLLSNGLEDFNISMINDLKSRIENMGHQGSSTEIVTSFDVNVDKKGSKYMFSGENGGGFDALVGYNGIQGKVDPTTNTFQTSRGKTFMFSNLVQFKDIKSYGNIDGSTGNFTSLHVSDDISASSISGISISQLSGEPNGSKLITVSPNSTYKIDVDKIVQHVKITQNGWLIPPSFDTYIWKYESGKLEFHFGSRLSINSDVTENSRLLVSWY